MGVLNSSRKVMKDFIEKSYSMGQLHGEMKKINDPRRQNLIETVHLTKAEENKIDTLFTANYGKKIKYDWHRLYQSFTGKFDENYFPEYLFSSVLEPKLNPMDYRYVLDDKLLLPLFCVGVEHVRTPRTYYSVCDGICFDEEKNIVDPVSDKVKIVQFTDEGKLATIKRIKKLHRVMKESAAEVVIPFLPIISLYTLIANIGLRKKVIMSERADPRAQFNNLPWKDKIGNFFMRKCGLYSLADWMVFQTHDAQSYYSEKIQRKSSIIPNPLDTAKLPERYAGEREKRIVAAGRFSEEKNFALLIDGSANNYFWIQGK